MGADKAKEPHRARAVSVEGRGAGAREVEE